jgi:hypothetical protein
LSSASLGFKLSAGVVLWLVFYPSLHYQEV